MFNNVYIVSMGKINYSECVGRNRIISDCNIQRHILGKGFGIKEYISPS